jgi:hypothetical protein
MMFLRDIVEIKDDENHKKGINGKGKQTSNDSFERTLENFGIFYCMINCFRSILTGGLFMLCIIKDVLRKFCEVAFWFACLFGCFVVCLSVGLSVYLPVS